MVKCRRLFGKLNKLEFQRVTPEQVTPKEL